jgi:hypothetical protein
MVKVVISKYNENVEWVKKLKHSHVIYDKSSNPVAGSIPLKNVGREAETFLYHIISNYNNLDDVTVFLQANPFEHLQRLVGWRAQLSESEINTVIEKMNNEITDLSYFSTFYQVLYNDRDGANGCPTTRNCQVLFGQYYRHFTVSPGAQYVVPKKYILSRSLDFWKNLRDAMHRDFLSAWSMEQLWYLAYMHKMDTSVGHHNTEKAKTIALGPTLNNKLIELT